MTLTGRMHPLLIHFPIALVLAAAAAELVAATTSRREWRVIAIVNLRAGALFAIVAAISGWLLAASVEPTPSLEYHRVLGSAAAFAVAVTALTTSAAGMREANGWWPYRLGLFTAAVLVGVAAHLGAVLVWGANFFLQQ
jgi:uncharacterized membrane protein